mgnify:CR=1 FL=1
MCSKIQFCHPYLVFISPWIIDKVSIYFRRLSFVNYESNDRNQHAKKYSAEQCSQGTSHITLYYKKSEFSVCKTV